MFEATASNEGMFSRVERPPAVRLTVQSPIGHRSEDEDERQMRGPQAISTYASVQWYPDIHAGSSKRRDKHKMAYQSVPGPQPTIAGPSPRAGEVPDTRQRDPLTQLWNRAAFDADLDRFAKAATGDSPSCLVFADVDHFKKVNDQSGHVTGDAVLKEVARRLMTVSAGKGHAYRYGGEEMVLMLPNHCAQEGLAVAERAREFVAASPLAGLVVTASFGVAIIPHHATVAEEWLKCADKAMYEAKELGRNLIRLFGEPPPNDSGPRRAERKEAVPGNLSEGQANALRKKLILGEVAPCPNDDTPLSAKDMTGIYSIGKEFLVICPDCGFHARLSSPHQGD